MTGPDLRELKCDACGSTRYRESMLKRGGELLCEPCFYESQKRKRGGSR